MSVTIGCMICGESSPKTIETGPAVEWSNAHRCNTEKLIELASERRTAMRLGKMLARETDRDLAIMGELAKQLGEKVSTPTDDEQEVLLKALEEAGFSGIGEEIGTHETVIFVEHVPDIVAHLGFRRTEVPEPSDEDEFAPGECDGSGTCAAPRHIHGCYTPHRADQCDAPEEYGHLSAQGEPSDAQAAEEADRRWPHTPGDPDTASARSARRLSFRQGVEWARAAGGVR